MLPMQHPKKADINFQSSVFVSRNAVSKILKTARKKLKGTSWQEVVIVWRNIFRIVSFLTQFAIPCIVISI